MEPPALIVPAEDVRRPAHLRSREGPHDEPVAVVVHSPAEELLGCRGLRLEPRLLAPLPGFIPREDPDGPRAAVTERRDEEKVPVELAETPEGLLLQETLGLQDLVEDPLSPIAPVGPHGTGRVLIEGAPHEKRLPIHRDEASEVVGIAPVRGRLEGPDLFPPVPRCPVTVDRRGTPPAQRLRHQDFGTVDRDGSPELLGLKRRGEQEKGENDGACVHACHLGFPDWGLPLFTAA